MIDPTLDNNRALAKAQVSGSMLMSYFQGAFSHGLTAAEILHAANVSIDLNSDELPQIQLDEFGRIIKTIFQLLNDEASGFLDRPIKLGTFAMMCHSTITCPNLRRALLRGAKFMDVVTDEIHFRLLEQGEEGILTLNIDNRRQLDDQYFITSVMIIWVRWASWLIDKPLLLERVNFTFDAPDYVKDFDAIFPCRHYFGQQENSIVINRRFLDTPIAQDDQSLPGFLASAPECLLTQYKRDDSATATIRRLLSQAISQNNGFETLTFDDIAEQLHMTTQTLRRRLKEEGNSFQEIKDSLRRDTAIYHLAKLETPINDLATLLGFSEASAFNRAFKKWTGMSPGAYRDVGA